MKRTLHIALCLLIACQHSQAAVFRVGKNQPYQTIRQAIASAGRGDTVLVAQGLYLEKNISITKPLCLMGENYPILDGENRFEIISVRSDEVTIRGFRLEHCGVSSLQDIAAIKIYGCHRVLILSNILKADFFGIYVQSGVRCRIENNQLKASGRSEQQSGNGIHCWKCDSMEIINNRISGHRDGIYFEFVTNSVIWRNISSRNIRYGLHFMFSHNDAYISNIFQNNGAGVSVMFTHGVKMFNNFFEDNWGDGSFGLLLKEISDSYVIGNKFTGNTSGIFMEGSSRIEVSSNEFRANGWAIKIQASCLDNVISHNNFLSNTFDIGTNGSLVLNTFNGNYWDRYEGYDLNRDRIGDVPYHPVSLFSMVVEKNPPAMILFRSLMTSLLDKTEKLMPSLTPENLKDDSPYMKPFKL